MADFLRPKPQVTAEEIRIEVTRKSIHLLIAFAPALASVSRMWTEILIAAGIVFYSICETLRMHGHEVPIVSKVTARAARHRDAGKFVKGPLTLGLGGLLSLLVFPPRIAAIAIYSLAFGDGLSSLIGRLFGRIRLPLTRGKSLEGSLTCFAAVFVSTLLVSGRAVPALGIAATAMVTEAVPLKDFDNIVLPLVTGFAALLLL